MDLTKGSRAGWSRFNKKNSKGKRGKLNGGKRSEDSKRVPLLSGLLKIRVTRFFFLRMTTRARTANKMALTELAGISIFVALSFQSLAILGESVPASETDKKTELKVSDKRTNNFRVPLEMPYDPNFWPARGRREKYPERVPRNICDILDRDFGLRCPKPQFQEEEPSKRKWQLSDAEFGPFGKLNDDLLSGCDRMGSNCYDDNAFQVTEPSSGKLSKKIPYFLDTEVLFNKKRSDELRTKKQRRFNLPKIILYGNGLYLERDNPYAEKKKKQDVFWITRGKKNFFHQQ